MLEFHDVRVTFRSKSKTTHAVDDISLRVDKGEFVSLVGPSGCGKSTLLNVAAGLVKPTHGEVRHEGKVLRGLQRAMGMVPQADSLFPWRTVLDNVILGLTFRGTRKGDARARARELLARVGLEAFAAAYPDELSGGMRQRVNIARTLAIEPDVLLMDEPFGALDAFTRVDLQRMLLELCAQLHKTVVFVTHDVTEAIALSDRVVVMGARPSRIIRTFDIKMGEPRDPLRTQEWQDYARVHAAIVDELFGEVDSSVVR